MVNKIGILCALLCAVFFVSNGCGKKVTKIDTEVKPPAQQAAAPVASAQPRSDSVTKPDIDAQMKEIFVPIYFAFDKSDLSEDAISSLGKIASFLKDNASVRVLIEGNADELGSSEYNVALGEKRARAAKNYLTGYGISENRLEITSYGKERPAVPNCPVNDDGCRSKNRRDEWKVIGK